MNALRAWAPVVRDKPAQALEPTCHVRHGQRFAAWVMLSTSLALHTLSVAQTPQPPNPQERLEAIRMSLIEATLQTPTTVRGMSWIDSRGALHELSVFKNSMTMRNVQVKGFERTPEGQVKALLDIQSQGGGNQDKPNPSPKDAANAIPRCEQALAGDKWRHPIQFQYQPDPRMLPAVGLHLALAVQQEWLNAVTADQAWRLIPEFNKPAISNSMTTYERDLLGYSAGQPSWQAKLTANSRSRSEEHTSELQSH